MAQRRDRKGRFATGPRAADAPTAAPPPPHSADSDTDSMTAHADRLRALCARLQDRQSCTPAAVTVTGANGTTWQVTPGVLDDSAREAFLGGQCHAFARAVSERTGWPMVAAVDRECSYNSGIGHATIRFGDHAVCSCQFNHVLVEGPDGRLLDAAGWHTTDELDEDLSFMPQAYLRGNDHANTVIDWMVAHQVMREPATDLAGTMVAPLLQGHPT